MKIACSLIILVVGVAAVHGAKPRKSPEDRREKGDDKLQHLRASLEKLMTEKRNVAPLLKSGNDKRDLGFGSHGGCHVEDFIRLFTSLPNIRDALFDLGNPEDVIAIVEEMAIVFGRLQNVMNTGGPRPSSFPPLR
ncbi:uncharacterized protein LOC110461740 [Mizuhopecten yessoensis]|uniref:Uncharacterized protein n=1 Tax=Mizuhopecten yessoensis TaxID=6573 RepID=A0A210PZN2_MIZYE|nr:uncharacterized protein LOC110461740 [Mizuhopecten yessoensis]OWF41953.1 hypothetical protein KP79_PYT10990 [Mizuhopecten yessoensis]